MKQAVIELQGMVSEKYPSIRFEHQVLDNRQFLVSVDGKTVFDRNATGGYPHKQQSFFDKLAEIL